ncbi:MAG TPA: hypothetical protein VK636_04685 [Gemmatimonadaceae bacterium]|nr:hypothetical protein [Gemmatimonadaceae bacterium]
MFAPTSDELKAFRAGGVREESRLGLRNAVGQEVAFGTRRGGVYPNAGIGTYALIRQSFLDAQYEIRLDKAMRAGTPGARPTNDPFSRALVPAAGNEMSAWFVASNERLEWPVADSVSGHEFLLIGAGKLAAGAVDPTVTLVLRHQELVLQWIRRLSREDGLTVIFSTHQPQQADDVADVVADDVALIAGPGHIISGPAVDVLRPDHLATLFGIELVRVDAGHVSGRGELIPRWKL